MLLATAEQVRSIDARAIARFGVPGVALMETAGLGAADVIAAKWSKASRVGVVVLAGKGNNGGDGFVVARHLAARARPVTVLLVGASVTELAGDAAIMADAWRRAGGTIVEVLEEEGPESVSRTVSRATAGAGVVVDALLGTGLAEAPRGAIAWAIEAIDAKPKVVSLDVPTGLDATFGEAPGACVRADVTVTFGLPKIGLYTFPGARFAGQVVLVRLGWPRAALESEPLRAALVAGADVARALPSLDVETHKGTRGRVLVIAGRDDRPGAAALATHAAFRAGAGLVTIATTDSAARAVVGVVPEAMPEPLASEEGEIGPASLAKLFALAEAADAIVVGPGLGTGNGAREVVRQLLSRDGAPAVVDADAIGAIVDAPVRACLLTPHPGEMGRLLHIGTPDVQRARVRRVLEAASRFAAVVLLKGARSVTASADGALGINPTGNAGLATAGSGDVLSGIAGAWLARGVAPFESACCAAWVHGAAADLAAADLGTAGYLAREVADRVPAVLDLLHKRMR